MRIILSCLISLYQKTLSPDHGMLRFRFPYGYCRFYPSCSQYAREAITTYGSVKGLCLSGKRIISCNPWNQGGVDQVPHTHGILKQK